MIVWENSSCPNILRGPWYAPKALITTTPQKKEKSMICSIPHLLRVISPVFLHLYVFSSNPKKDGTDTGWHEHYFREDLTSPGSMFFFIFLGIPSRCFHSSSSIKLVATFLEGLPKSMLRPLWLRTSFSRALRISGKILDLDVSAAGDGRRKLSKAESEMKRSKIYRDLSSFPILS